MTDPYAGGADDEIDASSAEDDDVVNDERSQLDHLAGQLDWVAERLTALDQAAADLASRGPSDQP